MWGCCLQEEAHSGCSGVGVALETKGGIRLGGYGRGSSSGCRESLLCGSVTDRGPCSLWLSCPGSWHHSALLRGGLPVLMAHQPPDEAVCWVFQAVSDFYSFLPPEFVSLSPLSHHCLVLPHGSSRPTVLWTPVPHHELL